MPQPRYNQPPSQQAPHVTRKAKKTDTDLFMDGMRAKDVAVMYGLLGFFFLGIIFGPLAIMSARKAEKHYGKATFGKVLGWIDILISIPWIWAFVAFLNGAGHLN